MLSTTTADTGDDKNSGENNRREARSAHDDAETVMRVRFKVAHPASGPPHRYYRAIRRDSGGAFHLAGGHVIVTASGGYAKDPAANSEPPLWLKRDVGLRDALHAVNNFVPAHQSGDAHVAVRFLNGRSKCRVLWECVKRWPAETNRAGNPEPTISLEAPVSPSDISTQTDHALLSPTSLRPNPTLDWETSGPQNAGIMAADATPSTTNPTTSMNTDIENPDDGNPDNENTENTKTGLRSLSKSQMLNHLKAWLKTYAEATSGVQMLGGTTIEFDDGSRTHVDALLRLRDEAGGQSQVVADRVEGAPELVVKMFDGIARGDMHNWARECTRKDITEPIAVNEEGTIPWHSPGLGAIYEGEEDIVSGTTFPGLGLDIGYFHQDDLSAQISQLRERLASDLHRRFEEKLESCE
mgnify:CR=1 FL=1